MKIYLFAGIGLALLGGNPLQAQPPQAVPQGSGGASSVTALATAPDGVACTPCAVTCVPEHYVKKTIKPAYSCGCEPLCVPLLRAFCGHSCGDCNHCNQPITRRYLIKKVRTCEENATKCVPAQVPACEPGCFRPGFADPAATTTPLGAPRIQIQQGSGPISVPPAEPMVTPNAR
jgi:hypothetical protein